MSTAEELREAIATYSAATTSTDRLAAYLWMVRVTRARASALGTGVKMISIAVDAKVLTLAEMAGKARTDSER